MGVSFHKLSLLITDKGIKLMLAPESHSAFLILEFPMVQGRVKFPRSCIFVGNVVKPQPY